MVYISIYARPCVYNMTCAQSGEQVLLLVNFRIYARRSPKGPEEAPIYIVQSERTTNSHREMKGNVSKFKHGVPSRENYLQVMSLLPVMLWQYQREVWLLEILKFMGYC